MSNTPLIETNKGAGDRRFSKGNVGARTEPRLPHGDISLWRFTEGQRYTLFLTKDDAYDLAEALDALLDYIEEQEDGVDVPLPLEGP